MAEAFNDSARNTANRRLLGRRDRSVEREEIAPRSWIGMKRKLRKFCMEIRALSSIWPGHPVNCLRSGHAEGAVRRIHYRRNASPGTKKHITDSSGNFRDKTIDLRKGPARIPDRSSWVLPRSVQWVEAPRSSFGRQVSGMRRYPGSAEYVGILRPLRLALLRSILREYLIWTRLPYP